MSGVEVGSSWVRKGAGRCHLELSQHSAGFGRGYCAGAPPQCERRDHARSERNRRRHREVPAGTPLAVAKDGRLLGVIHLKDIVKGGIRERFAELRRMGIRTVMITGDNPMTAAAIAADPASTTSSLRPSRKTSCSLSATSRPRASLSPCAATAPTMPGTSASRCRRAMNTGTQGRARGRQYGRSRFQSDQAHRDRRDRQAVADDPRRAHHLLDRQTTWRNTLPSSRRCSWRSTPQLQTLNIMRLSTPESAILSAIHLQCADHYRTHSAVAERRALSPDRRRRAAAAQSVDLRRRRRDHPVHRHQGDRTSSSTAWHLA